MIRGLYTAASGMLAEAERIDVTSNNLANANTAGFKKDVAVTKDFANILITRVNDGDEAPAIGRMGTGVIVDEVATTYTGGSIRTTGNAFDLAIEGRGFFAVQTPQGLRYTRNGTFAKSIRNQLVTSDGYQVLGENGPIVIDGNKMSVDGNGRVIVDNEVVGQLRMEEFADEKQLSKEGSSLFAAAQGAQVQPAAGSVIQGALEMSNVNVVGEMVNLITNYRSYEINAKVVRSHDDLLGKAANDIAKL
ncbi:MULTISPECIES: flagellar basal-body rod protein FlgF [Pelosinus]|uniref:Flagellar basal-body rod protein FlgF n=1 Tax=Pelosinus fermentans B4 TaxID=1149862 RepID=I9L6U0_9FIRM|nr:MULTISPECIES: flagellar basal-body rod protein FlgF [Pelosinus]EIW15956.1 flagellar basal-body rod protein FlgF [Pelosinus fermentans B4]EIW27338.1 flagellar basal-body rod protein FlgF [Pelosinus fermentans A11]OAM92705.1 flagellar basal-body rod protein FlgF [Pelosinus fermentans DSM 17108]SDQ54304.1 flagellar basal-body rod protein FlgG [Pelosinus fermentans]